MDAAKLMWSGRRQKVKEVVKHPFVEAEGEGEGKDSGGWRRGEED